MEEFILPDLAQNDEDFKFNHQDLKHLTGGEIVDINIQNNTDPEQLTDQRIKEELEIVDEIQGDIFIQTQVVENPIPITQQQLTAQRKSGTGTAIVDNAFKSSLKVGSSALDKNRYIFQNRRYSVDVDVHLLAQKVEPDGQKDVTMTVMVPCHKIFLRFCPYFSQLIDTTTESHTGPAGEILQIDIDIDYEILEEILRYIYTGEIEIHHKNFVQLFEASIKLDLNDELMVIFTKFTIGPLINKDNWLQLLRIFNSSHVGCGGEKFLHEIYEFMRENSSELMPLFIQLTFDEIRLILNPESRVYQNAQEFQNSLLLTWMTHNPTLKAHLIEELKAFNYAKLPIQKINQLIISQDAGQNTSTNDAGSISELDPETNSYSRDGDSESSLDSSESSQHLSKRARLSFSLNEPEFPTNLSLLFCAGNLIYTYSFHDKTCTKLALMPAHALDGFSMVLANERIFIMGGQNPIPTTHFEKKFPPLSNKIYSSTLAQLRRSNTGQVARCWRTEQVSLAIEMANFCAISIKGDIYTIGGILNMRKNDIFHRPIWGSYEYDLSTSRNKMQKQNCGWRIAFIYNFARTQCAITLLHGKLYIIGGIGFDRNLPLRDNMWGSSRSERYKLGLEVSAINSVEVFDIKDKKLETAVDLRQSRFDHQAVAFQNKIWVLGGQVIECEGKLDKSFKLEFECKLTDSVEIYDPVTNIWTDGPSLNVPRAKFATFLMDDKIFVLGGDLQKPTTMEIYDPRKNNWELAPCGNFPIKTNFSQFLIIKLF